MDYPSRKPNRLKDYDYSQNGAYFITICTDGRSPVLSSLDFTAVPEPQLTECGLVVDKYIRNIVGIDKYVIMPNHVHMIILVDSSNAPVVGDGLGRPALQDPSSTAGGASPSPTVGDVICAFKSRTTIAVNRLGGSPGSKLWQRSYYDHIIRDRQEYLEIWRYIDENPIKWSDDCYFEQ